MNLSPKLTVSGLLSCLLLTACSGNDGHTGIIAVDNKNPVAANQIIELERIGRTEIRGFAVSAAEITDFDSKHKRIFTTNAQSGEVDVFSASDITDPELIDSIDIRQMLVDNSKAANTGLVGATNSVSVHGDLAAIAIEANPKTDNGWIVFINTGNLSYVNAVQVGALPDMVTFTPDGKKVLVANEGEPDEGYAHDPEGTISVINTSSFAVTNVSFSAFNAAGSRHSELPTDLMVIDGYQASVAQSLEPEYITVSSDNSKAYVTLQENNAVAVVNLADNSIEKIIGLGFKDHSLPGNEMDASDKDSGVNLKSWPVMGIYMPDSIANMTYNDKTYFLTANEGDSREDFLNDISDSTSCINSGYYFSGGKCRDEIRVKDMIDEGMTLSTELQAIDNDANMGRLKASYFTTKARNGSTIEKVYAYGGRSFSIWDAETGQQVFDSANAFELITALRYGKDFNNNNDENKGDSRSDDKGPEPEALAVGQINGHTYAFIGLERMGGIMIYDVSNPYAPEYVQYVNDRDLTVDPGELTDAGDLGPEGFHFVPAQQSPNSKPLLVVGNEVSGTTSVYQINVTNLQ